MSDKFIFNFYKWIQDKIDISELNNNQIKKK
jgi:hypothetical protein